LRMYAALMSPLVASKRPAIDDVGPWQGRVGRNGHANGFKPRTFQTAIGTPDLPSPECAIASRPRVSLSLSTAGGQKPRQSAGDCSPIRSMTPLFPCEKSVTARLILSIPTTCKKPPSPSFPLPRDE
jgi:hypothetical protein